LLPTRSVILCAAPKFCAPVVVTLKRSLQVRALGGEKHDIVTQNNDGNHNHTRLQKLLGKHPLSPRSLR
jgi:hypothetical protein